MNRKTELRQALVTQSQAVMDARYDLNKDAKRFLMLVSQQSGNPTSQNNEGWYCVKVSTYADVFSLSTHEAGRDIRGAVKALWDGKITVYIREGDDVTEINKRWIIEEKKRPSYGEYWVRFHPDLLQYLHDFTKSYSHPLEHVVEMGNDYHIRLYDWIYANRAEGGIRIEIEYIRDRFELDRQPAYARYNNIKRRIIEPAIENINKYTPLVVEYSEIKDGRKVVAIKFTIVGSKLES